MIPRLALIVLACTLSASAATLDEVFPMLHPVDPAAPFAFRQWPQQRRERDNYGVTLMIWRDRATLIIDEKQPLTAQLRALPQRLTAVKAARRLRVMRWELTAEQCPQIPSLFASLAELPATPEEPPPPTEIPIHGFSPNRQEWFVRRGDSTEHFTTNAGWYQHAIVFQNVWVQLDACSKQVKGRRVRAR